MRYKTLRERRENAKAFINITITAIIVIVAIDFIGFLGWATSGQRPVDNFYVGTITTHTLQALTK